MDLDYDSCAQFLARLEADPENLNTDVNTTPNNVKNSNPNSLGEAPTGVLDTSLSLSPVDYRNSASPPGLSSGSVTSHSPESLRFDYDLTWNPNDAAFFSPVDEGILSNQAWDLMSSQGQPSNQQQGRVVTPLGDYIKVENGNSPGPYFGNSQQATISPTQSLIDPATQTALEGAYSFRKESDSLFDFNNYGGSGSVGQTQGNNPEPYSPLTWRNQAQQREDFTPIGWQSPPQAQQVSQQRQQRQQQTPQSQEPAPLVNSLSPSSSHRTSSSPDYRAHDSHSDDNGAIPRPKKRKTSADDAEPSGEASAPAPAPTTGRKQQPKKTAHNMIEKRYRTNLNDKIAALRDSVPSLRVMAGTSKLGEDDDEEDLEGLTPAHKLNKATVLAKATEYIRHLEKRTKRLQDENDQLKNRLAAFEKLATMGGSMGGGQSGSGSRGGGGPGGGLMSRLMVGSLAGLMVANGLQEQENGTRQLTAFPTAIMQVFGIPESSVITGSHLFWLAFRMALLVSAVVYIIVPSLFNSKEKSKSNTFNNAALSPVPSLASSLEVRRTAWLTAIQSVWVPRHSFALEIAALACKTLKLSLRKLIGWNRYALLTGMTEEHETARVKAWSIALDAQLAGGDATITHSRLILTLLASLTLPATPSRLMLNALHIRVLFWDLGSSFEAFAHWLANYYWLEARNVQQKSSSDTDSSVESLPEHLARLLELDPKEVLHSKIIQKAYNLAYDKGTGENCEGYDEGMDTVVEDESIRSPLDAVAAWCSSLVLQGVLAANLKTRNTEHTRRGIAEDLEAALSVAPPNSKAQLRTLVTKAMLEDKDDGTTLRAALKAFEEDIQPHELTPNGVPRIMVSRPHAPAAVTTDIKIAVRCAMALNLLRNSSRAGAIRLFSELDWQSQESGDVKNRLGLLGFVAIWRTLNRFIASNDRWAVDAGESVDKAAGMLRVWIGGKNVSKRAGVHKDDCKRVIDYCNSLQKKLAGLSDDLDDGYASGGLDAGRKDAGVVAA